MIVDARELPTDHKIDAHMCIIGGGAAGLTLASQLNGSPIQVCLLESGGLDFDLRTQALYSGVCDNDVPSAGDTYLGDSRIRMLGGTTTVWGGYCRPLEAIDFESRDWVPNSGWPFSRSHLNPYYDRASEFMGIGKFDRENPDADELPSYFEGGSTTEKVFRFQQVNLGAEHFQEMQDSRNVTVVLHANALELTADDTGNKVETLRYAALTGQKGTVRARGWVLAAGGIENVRLMLASNGVHSQGLGNQHDLVGRYFMEHTTFHHGMGPMFIWPRFPMTIYQPHNPKDSRAQFVFASDDLLRREKLMTVWASFEFWAADEHFTNFDRNLMLAAHLVDSGNPVNTHPAPPQQIKTIFTSEVTPLANSRVTLTNDRDELGMKKVKLEWRIADREVDTLYRFVHLMNRRIGELGMGRSKTAPGRDELIKYLSNENGHHVGTTRMHDDPKRGVVDADCRVHGLANLYVAGSSVFPTAGTTPTFTIIALAIRLADLLKRELSA